MLPPPLLFCLIWQLLTKIHKLKNSKHAAKEELYNITYFLLPWSPMTEIRGEKGAPHPTLQAGHHLCLLLWPRHLKPLPRPCCHSDLPRSAEVLHNERLLRGKHCPIHRASAEHWMRCGFTEGRWSPGRAEEKLFAACSHLWGDAHTTPRVFRVG